MIKELLIVGAEWCTSCKVLKSQLDKENIPYVYKDLSEATDILKEFGAKSLPFAKVNDEQVQAKLPDIKKALNETN
jgi:glutaredoxin-related protein